MYRNFAESLTSGANQNEENRTRGAPWEAKIGPRDAPQMLQKTGRKQKIATGRKCQAHGSNMLGLHI